MNNQVHSTPAKPNGQPSREALALTRREVRDLLLKSEAFRALPPDKQRDIAKHTVEIASYLAEPEGIRGNTLSQNQQSSAATADSKADPYAIGLADGPGSRRSSRRGGGADGQFTAQGAREGAAVAGALLENVNFPDFVSGLIDGVFHSIVKSSMEQMEAYGQLVADVAKTLNQFRDENVSPNQGRDHLVEQHPDLFMIEVDTGDDFFGEGGGGPRVRLRDGVDEDQALQRVNQLPIEGGPITSLDDETIEERLVPAARTQLATSRQQLLATMVLMGINRIVVTDGRISAKVLYNFQARDSFRQQTSATEFDYDPTLQRRTTTGDFERDYQSDYQGASYSKDNGYQGGRRNASFYSKGTYKTTAEPVLTLASATQSVTDAQLATKASLAGTVDVNFKSETFPLERMADSFQIGQIQNAAQPGQARAGRTAAQPESAPQGGTNPSPPAS